ncbi:MAG: thiamine pyrophosphate-binding protein [bacterium]
MAKIKTKHAFMKQLLADGVKYIFGNPGTLEESFLDALSDFPELTYVPGLQESVVTGMALGYARVTNRPAMVQVHTMVGLGNSMAMLYEARQSSLPLVVYAGEAPSKFASFDGFFAGDLVETARPVTKWAYRIIPGDDTLKVLRRAFKVAMTPPQGPVFLAIPMDVFDEEIEPDIYPTSCLDWQAGPPPEDVAKIVQALMEAENPIMLIGDQVQLSGGQDLVTRLADQLGCPVYGADFTYQGRAYHQDPLFMGTLNFSYGKYNHSVTSQADVVLAVGTSLFPEMFPDKGPYFRQGVRLFQVDLNPWEIAKNFPVEIGIVASPKQTLEAISTGIELRPDPEFRNKAAARKRYWQNRKKEDWGDVQIKYDHLRQARPMHPSLMMKTVAEMLPENAVIYDESITATAPLIHYLATAVPVSYFSSRGRCLGVGLSGAVGAKLAFPNQPLLALSGDGAALYVIQALWTAARHNLHIIFLICNNRSYRILKLNILEYWAEEGEGLRKFPHQDIDSPAIRFNEIARGFGLKSAWTATDPDSLRKALKESLADTSGPHLIDVQIEGGLSEEIQSVMGKGGGK